jgi:hypothetical protein
MAVHLFLHTWRGGMYFFCAHSMGEKPGGASFFLRGLWWQPGGAVLSFFRAPFELGLGVLI